MKKEVKLKLFPKLLDKVNSLFLINQQQFEENIRDLHSAFLKFYPKVTIGYSYKTNYIPLICKVAHSLGCWAEVVSEMEVDMALVHLSKKSNIVYNGPVKSTESIQKVIDVSGIINIDDINDLYEVQKLLLSSKNTNKKVKLALRLNFTYEGHDSRFGIEIKKINDLFKIFDNNSNLNLIGYHVHLPFRSVESFDFRVESLIKVLDMHGNRPLEYINLGGGFYGNINSSFAKSIDVSDIPSFISYGELIGKKISDYFIKSQRNFWPELFIEPGSSVVADVLWFLSKIHTLKQFSNRNIIVTYSARHLITPTNKSILFPIELYQSANSIYKSIHNDLYVVGYTCIESDILGKIDNRFDSSSFDFIAISNVGSYSIVMGSDFILPQPAIYNFNDGEFHIVRSARTVESILTEFVN